MTSTILANLALAKIGDVQIADISDTSNKAARLAALHYEPVLREVLRSHFWGFAMAVQSVTALAAPSATSLLGWDKAFALPDDFIKLRTVMDDAGGRIDKFDLRRVGGVRCLVSGNYATLALDYVQFIDTPDDWDPLFTAALVTLLASRLARGVTGSEALEQNLRQLYETVDLPAARTADAHDTQSGENHPLRAMLDGALTHTRGDFFPEL